MANPSLQIGNSNWAIKEDNLLGYSTAGTRFVPQPITMTRASAGTRVNSSGLVETVELLGSELVEDSNFPTPNTEWGTTLGWSIADNKASNDGTGGILRQTNTVPLNTKFKVVFTVADYVTGNIQIKFAPIAQNIVITGDATYTIYTDGNNSVNGDLQILATSSFQGSITNVSVKEVTKNNLARVDYDGTASSLLVEPESTNTFLYSEPTASQGASSGITYEAHAWDNGFTNCIKFGDNSVERYYYGGTFSTVGAISFFVEMDDGSEPFVGGGSGHDFSITINGALVLEANTYKENTIGNVWKIWATDSGGSSASSNGIYKRTANSTKGFRQVGLQLESLSYATSYIPTNGEAGGVTRNKDQYSKTGISNLINSEEGVLFVETVLLIDDDSAKCIVLSDGSSDNRVRIDFGYSSSRMQCTIYSSGDLQCNIKIPYVGDSMDKIAVKWKLGTNEASLWINGVELGTDTITSAPIGLNTLKFNSTSGSGNFFGKVKQLQVYDTALTPTQLQALTS